MPEKILIVDDDYETVKFLALLIKNLGYEPLEALNGMDALKLAHENPPNLIILDVMMPIINGFNFCRLVKAEEDSKDSPIILLTSRNKLKDIEIGLEISNVNTMEFDRQVSTVEFKKLYARLGSVFRR